MAAAAPGAGPNDTVDELTDGRLIHVGFEDLRNARRWLGFPELASANRETILGALERYAASPDTAVRSLVRLIEVHPRAVDYVRGDVDRAMPLIRLLGASEALGEFMIRHPENLDLVDEPLETDPSEISGDTFRAELLTAVGAERGHRSPVASLTGAGAYQALRVAYRRALTRIALKDLGSANPVDELPAVGRQLADLAAAAVDAGLSVSRAEAIAAADDDVARWLPRLSLAVIGMGKCGARELNYISDVDVIYVHELLPGSETGSQEVSGTGSLAPPDDDRVAVLAADLASGTARAIMTTGPEPPLWELDANLRPEGKDGPLSRTIDSHVRYYKKWAKSWEFQALLKARPMAGDRELGERYAQAITPFVWQSSQREGFVESVQAMRRRVTDNIPADDRERQIKLGPGGLRDVEFTVQLLQLVHGHKDERVRTQATTQSLQALSDCGYIARKDAEQFNAHYRWLRLLEHRIQLFRLRRTHLMPTKATELSVIAHAVQPPDWEGPHRPSGEALVEQWRKVKRQVRGMHEKIFYRPLLAALSKTGLDGVALSDEQVRDRLEALGYRDPRAAQRHLEALTKGVSRRAEILRTLLPVLLEWIGQGVDADAGLLGFRRVSEALGTTPWYLRMLRDSNMAAERLCQVLSSSRYVTDALENLPEAVAWLGKDEDLVPRSFENMWEEIQAQMERHDDAAAAIRMIRLLRRREVVRVALADACGVLDVDAVVQALSDIDRATVLGALHVAEREIYVAEGEGCLADVLVIAMGRQGGREIGYGSDADVMYAYARCTGDHDHGHRGLEEAPDGGSEQAASDQAHRVIQRMTQLLKAPCTPPLVAERPLEIDNDLRPEGKQGAMVRSVDSYREYYDRWADTWEFQALTRARPMAGSNAVSEQFLEVIDVHRYPAEFTARQLQDIRRMKARVENERLPRGADPYRHLKLGRGGLSDVEWLAQTLQLQHAHAHAGLRTTSTLRTLQAGVEAGLLEESDADALARAWRLCTLIRNYNVLRTGRASDVLPKAGLDMEAVARWCGYPPGEASRLEDDYLRITRHSRAVFERIFYGR
ncbi:bifunctional [glutamine synthetase] adenylyltransferase/[glutamine synthetase]-adenylyl-L-tyrosine phosphorylase [Kocuria sp. JC486]|uniref:bifunctional [glutamine synthetase] adenylyltransferase/[glutamine synthetase]-adenylyl-L-tyrosine phosphorylase n=1 Tax=Kocuria sp. JC486 TaxID=1970736 RepID=UPI0014228135|nr:bifunctional [glutamine synthetase] adenylyltransferase/[glutamine synthetase]-adenylyl-L-tyrosine phosphorylase [Kocuria sp. JC486]NHU84391.1 bifunctional [glutamine synthetase] adenylyltransferase/[glutamine synthetase]-adenylyl-L-tyrosine phosphorylase [Kocuria sp. JC486]